MEPPRGATLAFSEGSSSPPLVVRANADGLRNGRRGDACPHRPRASPADHSRCKGARSRVRGNGPSHAIGGKCEDRVPGDFE